MTTAAVLMAILLPVSQDIDKIVERADKLFDEAKSGYEAARSNNSVVGYVDAGFKLEEARIKYFVIQEIGTPEQQKFAADRLKAVNQLGKLLHDGKVSIGGTPAEPAPVKPPDPAQPAPPPPPPPPKAPVDVAKRLPAPDVAKQRDAEKLIKDLFKEKYARKTPADRKALSRALLDQAVKSPDDPPALWVLCKEAQDVSTQNCDPAAALEAIELAAGVFDVDALSMKSAALTAAVKAAKSPEDMSTLALWLLKLVDELIRADQFETADKTASTAVQCARKSGDPSFEARVGVRAKEVSEAKTLFQAMKSVMQTQARNPDDPAANLEIGRFLSFVKGSWDLGLRFLVKGSDAVLKSLAQRELAVPAQSADWAALADGWYDLSEKEKSPLRKNQLRAHAKVVYESALADAPALVRAKIEKRLGEMNSAAAVDEKRFQIDLLKVIDLAKDSPAATKWRLDAGVLVSTRGGGGGSTTVSALVNIPYVPPDEYDLTIVVERKEPGDYFKFGVLSGRNMVSYVIDANNNSGVMGYDAGGHSGQQLPVNKSVTIVSSVRRNSFKVTVDGKTMVDFKSGLDHPSGEAGYPNGFYLQACNAVFHVSKIALTPISGGQGKRLR